MQAEQDVEAGHSSFLSLLSVWPIVGELDEEQCQESVDDQCLALLLKFGRSSSSHLSASPMRINEVELDCFEPFCAERMQHPQQQRVTLLIHQKTSKISIRTKHSASLTCSLCPTALEQLTPSSHRTASPRLVLR